LAVCPVTPLAKDAGRGGVAAHTCSGRANRIPDDAIGIASRGVGVADHSYAAGAFTPSGHPVAITSGGIGNPYHASPSTGGVIDSPYPIAGRAGSLPRYTVGKAAGRG